jgi:flagellar biosynthesis GTPase FlhF
VNRPRHTPRRTTALAAGALAALALAPIALSAWRHTHVPRLVERAADLRPAPGLRWYLPDAGIDSTPRSQRWTGTPPDPVPARAVLLVHGLDEPGGIWDALAPALAEAGHPAVRFEYPNDQPPARSAALLADALADLRRAGLTSLDIVAHSMGGLVATDVLTRPEFENRARPRVPLLVTVGTPFDGSPWADLQPVSELREQIASLQKMMGQVLESTRRTSVAMGKVDPHAAEAVEPGPLLTYINKLVDNDAPMDAVDKIMSRVRDRLDAIELKDEVVVRQAVLREIEATIDTRSDSLLALSAGTKTGRPRVISLIGPTGVGKTTTVAKLAATCKLRHGRRVGLITSDTYRIAAVEQLRTYAGIIGLPIKVVMSPEEMSAAIADFSNMDVIIVDTAGRSQHDARRLDDLKAFIAAAGPDETHLVLASTVGDTVMRRTAERFMPLGPDRCILTKLDEAVCTGQIAGLTGRIGLPFSFVTVGQEVPDDIEPARADRLARAALDGPGVLCKGSDGRD